jgi:hypothetical protein
MRFWRTRGIRVYTFRLWTNDKVPGARFPQGALAGHALLPISGMDQTIHLYGKIRLPIAERQPARSVYPYQNAKDCASVFWR